MLRVEREYQRPLEQLLPEMVNEHGLSGCADKLGVSKGAVGYWLMRLGINMQRVALAPGATLTVSNPVPPPFISPVNPKADRTAETVQNGGAMLTHVQMEAIQL